MEEIVFMGKRIRAVIAAIQGLLIIIMTVLIACMVVKIDDLQGTARVINYAGLVRGATQREIKLEIAGQENDELIAYLNEIIYGLRHESQKYNLVQLPDEKYLADLDKQIVLWQQLKEEIYRVRRDGYAATDIVNLSEKYFRMADNTVSAAEEYSQSIADTIRSLEYGTVADVTLLIAIMIIQTAEAVVMRRRNRQLEQKAFIDEHTGLPNKGRCELFFSDSNITNETFACIVFDLNNLKKANDTLGHSVGDQLIANFARLLRNAIPAPHFVGRYGGDEFMAVIYGADKESVEKILDKLYRDVGEFNQLHHGNNGFIDISYAYGWALSSDLPGCSFRVLFDQADRHMYENKIEEKRKGISE